MPRRTREAELGHFLRSRRQRLQPADVGLPTGPRRRAKGLLREEVAVLAHVSSSRYDQLEQGRKVGASAEMLDALAEALRLDEAGRRYLHALGGRQPESMMLDQTVDAEVADDARRLVTALAEFPHPVFAVDGVGNLIAWNRQTTLWYGDFAPERPDAPPNIDFWFFTSSTARARLAEWTEEASGVVARMRFASAFSRSTSPVHAVHGALYTASPEFARWWDAHDVADDGVRVRRLRRPTGETRSFNLLTTRADLSPAISVVFHLPVEERAESTAAESTGAGSAGEVQHDESGRAGGGL